MNKKVGVVVLNYNNFLDTIQCIDSLLNNIKNNKVEVILVDNNSTDKSEDYFKEKFSHINNITIIQTGKNLGYAGGNNIGIKYAIEKLGVDYICILNNDVIVEGDFLSELINYLENNNEVGIIGPKICEYENTAIIQSTGGIIDLKRGRIDAINNQIKENNLKEEIIECDYVGGACLLFNKKIIDEIGYIPEEYFLFFEETEWCLKIKKLGYKVICNCKVKVIHKGSASINKIKGLSEYFFFRNRIVFEKRNATKLQYSIFLGYLILETTYRIIFKRLSIQNIKFYIDGILNNNKYSYLLENL